MIGNIDVIEKYLLNCASNLDYWKYFERLCAQTASVSYRSALHVVTEYSNARSTAVHLSAR